METETAINLDITGLPDTTHKRIKYIPSDKILELHEKGLSDSQIAKLLGCSRPNITQRLQKILPERAKTHEFIRNRALTFADLQRRIVESLTDADIKRMAPDRRIWSLGVLYDKERLERGQSTENLAIASISAE